MSMRACLALGMVTTSLGLIGCEEKSGFKVGSAEGTGECDLSYANIADTEWVYLRANPDKTDSPDIKTRGRFYKEGEQLKIKYNVGSVADFYEYNCNVKGEELICKEKHKIKDWCQALMVVDKECTKEELAKLDPDLPDDETIAKGVAAATEVVAKFKGTDNWEQFKLLNNNLGNKLQGLLYMKIDQRNCRLRITDNYMTIYEGKRREDSNPAGTNPFVKNPEGELFWEHCTNSQDLIDAKAAEFPEDPANVRNVTKHAAAEPVHFWYLGSDGIAAADGCTYSYDTWYDGKPGEKGLVPEVAEVKGQKQLRWKASHTWAAPTAPNPGVTHFVMTHTCEGKEPVETIACNAVMVQ